MDNFLTKDDFKRFIGIFNTPYLINDAHLKTLLKNKSNKHKVDMIIEEHKKEFVKKIDASDVFNKFLPKKISLELGEDNKVGFFYDGFSNVVDVVAGYLPSHDALPNVEHINNVLEYIMAKYMIGDRQEAIDEIKYFLNNFIADLKQVIKLENSKQEKDEKGLDRYKLVRKTYKWIYNNIDNYLDLYKTKLPEEIYDYIDYDKFLLYQAYGTIDFTIDIELGVVNDRKDKYSEFLYSYLEYLKYRKRENSNYFVSYQTPNTLVTINTDNIESKVYEHIDSMKLKTNKPDVSKYKDQIKMEDLLSTTLIDLGYSIKRKKEQEERLKRKEEFIKSISLNWELLPSEYGKDIKENKKHEKHEIDKEKLSEWEQKRNEILEKKIELFADLPYIATLKGTNHFEGYTAYVFLNGKVIFEKFYINTKKEVIPVMGEAIYVMDIESFEELSRQSKKEVRKFIKESNNPNVKVINHTDTFDVRVRNEVEDTNYSKDTLEYIDMLLESQNNKIYEKQIQV